MASIDLMLLRLVIYFMSIKQLDYPFWYTQ
jgi:hypothetical protein